MLILVGWLWWGLRSQSTIFQSCRDGAIASWVINQYFRGVKCLAQGHNTAAVGLEPRTSRSGVRHSTTEPPRSPLILVSDRTIYNSHRFRTRYTRSTNTGLVHHSCILLYKDRNAGEMFPWWKTIYFQNQENNYILTDRYLFDKRT